MRAYLTFRKRAFLNPVSANQTSYIFAHVESSHNGAYPWGDNLVYVADSRRIVKLEFFIGTARARRIALAKIDLLLNVLTSFRDALAKEIASIEKVK